MRYNGARIVVESLLKENVDTIFAYPGGAVIRIFDEFYKFGKRVRLIYPRHEQAATHAADGYARSTGKVGVVLVTSGPGATNTVTGIATAYMDSVSLVIITGQVSTNLLGSDAFQEVDIIGITTPVTKENFLITDIKELGKTIKTAFYLAQTGRPGPVLIDIPVDVQKAEAKFSYPAKTDIITYKPAEYSQPLQIKRATYLLKKSTKPLVICGGGVNISNSMNLLNNFINVAKIPVVHTLQGHGINPMNKDLYYGGIGMHGSIYGNYAVQNANLIIAFGVRFSDRTIGDSKNFASNAKIIQVDIDPTEIDKNVETDVPIVGDIKNVLLEFFKVAKDIPDCSSWIKELEEIKKKYPLTYERNGTLKPQYLIELANKYFKEDTIVVTDVGQHQMWVSQYYRFRYPRTFLTSGGLGTMGYALPAGIGVKIGNPFKEVLVITGDGGLQMNIQELMTIKRYRLSLKIMILDNNCLGMVRQWQHLFFGKRYVGTSMSDNPSFATIGNAVGIEGITLEKLEQAEETMKRFARAKHAMLVHAKIPPEEIVLPMVQPGASLDKQIIEVIN